MKPSDDLEAALNGTIQLSNQFENNFINSGRLDIFIGIDRCASLEDEHFRKEAIGLLLKKIEQETDND